MSEGERGELPDYIVEGALNYLSDMTGFSALHADVIERGHVRNRMTVPKGATNIIGTTHGGFIMALLDSTCGMAAHTMGYSNTTVQMSVNFLKPVCVGEEILFDANVLHGGKRTSVVECHVTDSVGKVLVSATSTLFNLEYLTEESPLLEPFYPRNDQQFGNVS
ncbi:PaaI family thioesterase [Curtanaerobium respiraculi]|uniref:PaaI family thioesterase n=1 Tax=Curtanaerobium respiraculi TaxID=2949669 RepID=UPI0024B3236A|nr:PaaI family thioesterase [Curtanaerobium respiraculi]